MINLTLFPKTKYCFDTHKFVGKRVFRPSFTCKFGDFELEIRFNRRYYKSPLTYRKKELTTFLGLWGITMYWGTPGLEEITVCGYCDEEIQRVGEDYLDYCEDCQSIEGPTEVITIKEYEARHG